MGKRVGFSLTEIKGMLDALESQLAVVRANNGGAAAKGDDERRRKRGPSQTAMFCAYVSDVTAKNDRQNRRWVSLKVEDADTTRIEQEFKQEPGLTLNLLRLTNSAASGLSTHITSLAPKAAACTPQPPM